MEEKFLKTILSCLNIHSFEAFIIELLNDSQEPIEFLKEVGEGTFFKPIRDSYGGSLHSVYLMHYLPLELFQHPDNIEILADPLLIKRLKKVGDIYYGQIGYWGMVSECLVKARKLQSLALLSNLAGLDKSRYEENLLPKLADVVHKLKIKVPDLLIGSYDSFIERNYKGTEEAFRKFITTNREGISICFNEEQWSVDSFSSGKTFSTGVLSISKTPCEPVFINPFKKKEETVMEFETLLRKETKESELESFLAAHYKEIFGNKYDRIETQLWLKFPELDIAGKKRRLDIFLRNSIINDWELFEIKRVIPLTGTYRDTPIIAKEITYAVQQVKNYARILAQDASKRRLAQEGIKYYEPSLNLVVGKTPQINHEQWRWLVSSHDKDVKIITFDNLLEEMKQRLNDLSLFLEMDTMSTGNVDLKRK